ncbi:MAG: gamma-glutamyl-gamma-aminobutyrate hydrolase [Lysobacteraceae bacterium]|nr:MAG: gamma-glutamyl-gamma-aminobutyrate hydrolase [Xanthomonadaceae bacterium]
MANRRPIIGVTGNHRRLSPSWICIRLSVFLTGGTARRISIRHSVDLKTLDAIIVSGGDDIHPSLYGAEEMPKAVYDPKRDELEQAHIHHALDHGLPLLGICRGHQLINVVLGGKLHSDIRDLRKATSNRGTILPRKTALLESASRIHQAIAKDQIKINSLHHQAVDKLGDGMQVSARDLDHFVQGAEHQDKLVFGVQWHPEYLFYLSDHRAIFGHLISLARQRLL